jgi:hypothetical protein
LTTDITAYNQKYDISYQLGAYYDMCYREYFTRFRFIFGLSKYNDDDTVSVREEEVILKPFEKYDRIDRTNYWNTIRSWEIQEQECSRSERDNSHTPSPLYMVLDEMAKHIQKENLFDEVVNEFLLYSYPDMDEQEFQVCRTIVWVMSDLSSGRNQAYYQAVVEYLLDPQKENRRDLFTTIKDVEDTILRLVHKGILSQNIDVSGKVDIDTGTTRWRFDEPYISLSFTKDSVAAEVIVAIGESFSQEIHAFVGPHTNYDAALTS